MSALSVEPLSIPQDLGQVLPQEDYPWTLSQKTAKALQPMKGASYLSANMEPDSLEGRFVTRLFMDTAPSHLEIWRIEAIKACHVQARFEANLYCMEEEGAVPEFQPDWESEIKGEERASVMRRWQRSYTGIKLPTGAKFGKEAPWRHTHVVPLWRGATDKRWNRIAAKIGMTYEGKVRMDGSAHQSKHVGCFGSGVYHTNSVHYARGYAEKSGQLVLSWVSMRKPFPVVDGDRVFLEGGNAYKNYNAHYIPVRDYEPPKDGQFSECDELVVFQQAQVMPRFIVHIGNRPSVKAKVRVKVGSKELIALMDKVMKAPLRKEDKGLIKAERVLLYKKLMAGDTILENFHRVLFRYLYQLVRAVKAPSEQVKLRARL